MSIEELPEPVKTGSFIDEFDGLYPGELHLFYGPPASGKTLGCLTIVAYYLNLNPDKYAIYLDTESLDPKCRLLKRTVEKLEKVYGLGDVLPRIHFQGFTSHGDLHAFLSGKKDAKPNIKDLVKKYDVGILVIDSLTRFYAKEMNNAPPSMRPSIAGRFGAKLMVWLDILGDLMGKPDIEPFPILGTAWMKSSRIAEALRKTKPSEVDSHLEDDREFLGGKVLAHSSKIIYRVIRIENAVTFTQIRGPHMGKIVKLTIPPKSY